MDDTDGRVCTAFCCSRRGHHVFSHESAIIMAIGRSQMAKQVSKGGSKKDACYTKVKSRYKVFPSAYASGAIAKCRKVGAKNWGNKAKKRANGGEVISARGCGRVMNGRRKKTRMS